MIDPLDMTREERRLLAGLDAEGQALGLDLLRDPNPRLRAIGRMLSEAKDQPDLLKVYGMLLEADPLDREACVEWIRRDLSSRLN